MRKKFILTSVLFTVFVLFFMKGVFATNYSNKFISVDIPKTIEKYYSNVNEDNAWESFSGGSVSVHYDVYPRSTYSGVEYTKSFLDEYVKALKEIIENDGDTCSFIHKDLVELNGCKGMRITYKVEMKSYNSTYYVDEYDLLSDKWEYTLTIQSSSKNYIDGAEAKGIVKSFRIKDTVRLSRGIPFVDVPSNSWYESAVKYVENNNIIKGTNDYTFAPTQKLTRGMLVTILHRMAGMPKVSGNSKFSDVKDTKAYYYTAVMWASKNNIVSGYSNGKFGPNDSITREQLAVMLNNYCKYKGKLKTVNGNLNTFKDSNKISSYAKNAMNWASGNGVITGSNGYINPKGNATRAETASMIYKYCLKFGK